MTTPAQMALEYKIWAFASPRGWNVTPGEIAEELGVTKFAVGHALKRKGWSGRVRVSKRDAGDRVAAWQGGVVSSGHLLADDVAHGRINMSVE